MAFSPKKHEIPLHPRSVAIQGIKGTFAHATCEAVFRNYQLHSCVTFNDAFNNVADGKSDAAIIPVANTEASYVPYVHALLKSTGLYVAGEYHLPVEHNLLTVPGAKLSDVKIVHSHPHALAQCSKFLKDAGFQSKQSPDTATAAKMVADGQDPSQASISSALAADLFGLEIKKPKIQNRGNNITRFFAIAPEQISYRNDNKRHYITTVILKPHRSLIYPLLDIEKVLQANKVVHSVLLEFTGLHFRNEGYYMELVGHPKHHAVAKTINELKSISSDVKMIGSYPTHHFNRFPQRSRAAKLIPEM